MDLETIQKKLEKKLKKSRYQHTLGVMFTAASMAMRFDVDIHKAMLAGLLHDCGKFCPPKDQIKLCGKLGLELTEIEKEIPPMIHARLGACLAEKEYGVEDEDILNAILHHTTGRPQMSMLEKIIFLADYIEPGRKMIPGLEEVRHLSFKDIDAAVCMCARNTLDYLEKTEKRINPLTEQTYLFYDDSRGKRSI